MRCGDRLAPRIRRVLLFFLVPSDRDSHMSPETGRVRWLWVILFLFALSVRLYRVDWDQHHFFHPDERAIGFAVERLSFSPLQLNPHFFAYGSLPLYAIKIATSIAGKFSKSMAGYDSSIFAGRILSALWGAATALLVGVLGARLYGRRVGLLAGLLMAADARMAPIAAEIRARTQEALKNPANHEGNRH